MRFSTAWANIAKQNVSLKVALVSVSVASVFLSIGFMKTSFKDPIVIERSCKTESLVASSIEPTVAEMKQFVKKALLERYSSEEIAAVSYLSKKLNKEKLTENKLFKKKDVVQLSLVRSVDVTKDKIIANVDRIFSMGKTRPAYPSKFALKVQSIKRTLENPYGLILVSIKTITQKNKEAK